MYRFLPSKYNREIKSLKTDVERLLMEIIESRKDNVEIGRSSSYGDDLLGLLLNQMDRNKNNLNVQIIMDECKTFFFTGHETTSLLLTWTLMLLAHNPSWQDKVRLEVRQVCGQEGIPSVEQLSSLTSVSYSYSHCYICLFLFIYNGTMVSIAMKITWSLQINKITTIYKFFSL